MKVSSRVPSVPSQLGRALVAILFTMAISFGAMTAPASAITRPVVIKRANHWIKKRVRYSQHAYYAGYRRDCSGFVSMAWKLRTSYTSSTIRSRARKISWRHLRPGDAVRRSGHVEIFAGWKSKKHRLYVALEESGRGKPALRRVKQFKRGYSALRRRGLKEYTARRATKPVSTARPVVAPVTPPSIDVSSSITPTAPIGSVIAVPTTGTPLEALPIP